MYNIVKVFLNIFEYLLNDLYFNILFNFLNDIKHLNIRKYEYVVALQSVVNNRIMLNVPVICEWTIFRHFLIIYID